MSDAEGEEGKDIDEPIEVDGFHKLFGLLVIYYILSGTVVLFIILNQIELAKPIIEAMGPFQLVGQVVLALVAFFANFLAIGILAVNMDKVRPLFEGI